MQQSQPYGQQLPEWGAGPLYQPYQGRPTQLQPQSLVQPPGQQQGPSPQPFQSAQPQQAFQQLQPQQSAQPTQLSGQGSLQYGSTPGQALQPSALPQQPVQQPLPTPWSVQGQQQVQPQPAIFPQQAPPPGQPTPGMAQSAPPQWSIPSPQQGQEYPLQASQGLQQAMGQPSVPLQQSELGFGTGQQLSAQTLQQQSTVPPVDVFDTPESVIVVVDLPGFDEESIQLQASGNSLHVLATRREEPNEEERPLQRERRAQIERTITLPAPIDVEQAEANFQDGVCKITLPKSEESQQQAIAFQ